VVAGRRLSRRAGGGVRVSLPPGERLLLLDLAATLREVIADVGPDTPPTPLTGRLFPRAYEDPLDQLQHAETAIPDLVESKRTLLDTFEATLRQPAEGGGRWRAALDDEGIAAWLAVLQDARLVLARLVGIEHEHDWDLLDPAEDGTALALVYLGGLLDDLVGLVMGGMGPAPPRR
jgi:hypothetical protein